MGSTVYECSSLLWPADYIADPPSLGQMVTQGALILAFLLALMANPRGIIRPNLFLVLLSVLAVVALAVSIHNQFMLGSTFRGAASSALLPSSGC